MIKNIQVHVPTMYTIKYIKCNKRMHACMLNTYIRIVGIGVT